jgi:hypothetical protein
MRFPLLIVTILLFLLGCARVSHVFERKERVYQPPRIGAESRFEEGLKREKRPQELFSKKERKDMEKMGLITPRGRYAPGERITIGQADSILTGKTRDTAKVPTDSTQAIPADSTLPRPVDTTTRQ